MLSVSMLFHRFGPYHHARLKSTAKICHLTAIELFAMDQTYKWDKVEEATNFTQLTLFDGADSAAQSSFETCRRVEKALSELRPHVVVTPGWADKGALAALKWCIDNSIPVIVMSESQAIDEPRKWWKEAIKKRVIGLYSSGQVGGTPHADYLAALGMPRERIFTGYDVVDNSYFASHAEIARQNAADNRAKNNLPERFFLASNRFVEKKNLSTLLRAYASYREAAGPGYWKLVLVGDGPLKLELTSLKADLALDVDLLLPGFKQYDELPLYYGLAGAFVHASTTEQWGLVVNEAMASGLPVLVSERCGCAPDLVRNGINGFTFDPYDVESLAKLMLNISSGECDLTAMGRASREIISAWGPETFAENLMHAAEAAKQAPRSKASLLDRMLLWGLMRR